MGALYLFSHADAMEMNRCNFKMAGICGATIISQAMDLKSIAERIKIVAIGANCESATGVRRMMSSPAAFVRIAGDGTFDMVDQAISMAFGESRGNNYVRIQGSRIVTNNKENGNTLTIAEEMLAQKNVESVLFSRKKLAEKTHIEKLEMIGGELMKEEKRA
ncbi:patatin-like protein 7 [Olea europaea var. sylvestris]|uniref:patatin-like protein 7 n=1 Tax=Olea europaea var. sylvestris TaxID=158386 RepID=UPI000C1D5B9F|nr:patatin-like protein 7 [Olea europaea var. sylvestris]